MDSGLDDNCGTPGTEDNCTNLDETTTTIMGLTADTSYNVRVRASNVEGDSGWTLVTRKTNRNKEANTPNVAPAFSSVSDPSVNENTPSGQDVGSPISAGDNDGGTMTYSLEGPDKNSFSIGRTDGQIKTRASLNHEDKATYTVRVKVLDGQGGSASQNVTISVGDVDEPPPAPAGLRVTATKDSGWSLDLIWSEPRGNRGPAITDYDIKYRKFKAGTPKDEWQLWPHGTAADANADNTDRSAKITKKDPDAADPLEPRTSYEVQVRAKNGEADGSENWSSPVRGVTGASNRRPSFESTTTVVKLTLPENTRSGQNVGSAVSATDDDGDRRSYSLDGPDAASFDINRSTGHIRTKSGVKYDFEEKSYYSLTVKVDDGRRKSNSIKAISVTIEIVNQAEPPSVPTAPRVTGISGSTDSIRVTWDEPANSGPPITEYGVQWAIAGTDGFRPLGLSIVDKSTIITGLQAGTRYDVQVRATNDEGTGGYSRSGTGSPNPDIANRNPVFFRGARTFSVAENTGAGEAIGAPVEASDPDDDPLTYALEGADAVSFDIDRGNGQIRTSGPLNHEEKSRHSVIVRARDRRGGTATAGVTINVTDIAERPSAPLSPTVTTASSTSLAVGWEEPENTGPPITDYDYRYKEVTDSSWTEVTNTRITGTTVTIQGLAASTSYDVEVLAKNAEGASDWSNSGVGSTAAAGANSPPVFTEGTSATRSVSASAPTGTSIGDPIAATDADSDDTLTYSLEGRDAPSFAINETNGQLLTRSGVRLIVGETYTVTVVADDGTDFARISVMISATAAPPNNPPAFSEGASTTRSVREDAAPGTSIGSPVRATDADTGDTVTHILEGTDAAAFTIVASSGQIQTLAALDATTKATYAVMVRATDSRGGSATIGVTITVTTALPTTFGCATRGAVDNASNTGLVADCEALLRARDNLENGARILNWSVVRPISQWDGVTVSGTPQRVTRLYLRSLGLVGTLPADLNSLTMLTRLWLHNNSLAGEIPDLSGLRNLESLWLSGSNMNLSGDISRLGLGSKTRLDTVSLWGNRLTGSIPDLSRLRSLVRVKLQSNSLSGGIPATLGSLRDLRLRNNPLGGSIPPQLNNIASLQILALENTGLTGSIPDLSGLTRLRTLNVRDNNLTGGIPAWLGGMDNMVILNLHTNQLTGSIPTQLGNVSNLQQLYLHGNGLTGSVPTQLGSLTKLLRLFLHRNQLTGDIPSELGNLSDTLTHLRLAGNTGLTGCVPSALSGVANNDLADLGLPTCP